MTPRAPAGPAVDPDRPWLRRAIYPASIVALCAVKVWLDGGLRVVAMPAQSGDDGLYVKLAETILRGEWLGSFDYLTLLKNPFYPMWLAATHLVGAPLLQAQAVLCVVAGVLFVRELVARGLHRAWAFALFAAYALNPFVEVRLMREGIYGSLCVGTLALAATVARHIGQAKLDVKWSVSLGLFFTAAWLTREESVLLVPPLALLLAWAFVSAPRAVAWRGRFRAAAMNLAVVGAVGLAVLGAVALTNKTYYGVFRINDHASPYSGAIGAVLSVEHPRPVPFLVVPREVRARLYSESPAFASLLPFLDGSSGSRDARRSFLGLSCAVYPITCGDYAGSWLVWALRLAAADAGHYRSARDADAFWARLRSELDVACREGRLRCDPWQTSSMPPLRGWGLETVFEFAWAGTHAVLSFPVREYVWGPRPRSDCSVEECRRVEWLAGSPVAPPGGEGAGALPAGGPGEGRRAIGRAISDAYRRLFGPMFLLSCLVFLGRIALAAVRRSADAYLGIQLALLVMIVSRILVLAYMEATSFPTFGNWPSYITPLYPPMLLFAALVIAEAAVAIRCVRGRRGVTAASTVIEEGSTAAGIERERAA